MPAVPLPKLSHLDLGIETARDLLDRRPSDPPVEIALDPLRRLLPAGLHRGELVEIHGAGSSGRFSVVLAMLAATTAGGESAALVDLGDHFDPQNAVRAGVLLARLLWLRPSDLKQALAATETAISGGFPLVICDLGAPPIRGGRAQGPWLRLLGAARAHRAVLLVSSPYRVSGTAATTVIEARRGPTRWRGTRPSHRLLVALGSRLTLHKARGGRLETSADLLVRHGELVIG